MAEVRIPVDDLTSDDVQWVIPIDSERIRAFVACEIPLGSQIVVRFHLDEPIEYDFHGVISGT